MRKVHLIQLLRNLITRHPLPKSGVITCEQLSRLRLEWNTNSSHIVLTTGCFDLLHYGHIKLLTDLREKYPDSVIVVGVNDDESVSYLKGAARPIIPGKLRVEMLAVLRCVDYVILFDSYVPIDLINKVCPNVYAKGSDYETTVLREKEALDKIGAKLVFIPIAEGWSTTSVIDRVRRGVQAWIIP